MLPVYRDSSIPLFVFFERRHPLYVAQGSREKKGQQAFLRSKTMPKLIVLTCAAGKQCSSLIPLLLQDAGSFMLRLLAHSDTSLALLREKYPQAQVIKGDLGSPVDCKNAVDGASTIYYVGPTFSKHETQYGLNFIDAAVAEASKPNSQLTHFILSSVLHPELSKLVNHDRKRHIEEYLCESTLPYTILQPSHFADNAMPRMLALMKSPRPVFMAAHNPAVSFSFSCTFDLAQVSAKVIREGSKHYFATYQLVSTWPMKYTEFVESIGKEMGRTIEIQQSPYDEITEKYCELVFGKDQVVDQSMRDGPERLLLYYNSRGIVGNPGTQEWLLNRPGTTPAQLFRRLMDQQGVK